MTPQANGVFWIGLILIFINFWVSGQSTAFWGDIAHGSGGGGSGGNSKTPPVSNPGTGTGPGPVLGPLPLPFLASN